MSGEHAVIAPSSADITIACPGSVTLSMPYLDTPETDEQAEGTAGHWVASSMAEGVIVVVGQQAPNGVAVDDEMIEGAIMYLEAIEGRLKQSAVEKRLEIPEVHPQCWGTPDYREYNPATRTLRIIDYKYGHRFVEVYENVQLAAYASGAMSEWGLHDLATFVEFCIVQPRCFHKEGPVRWWKTPASNLRPLVNRLSNAAHRALAPEPVALTGDHCLFCAARHVCTAQRRATAAIVDFSMTADYMLSEPDAIARELDVLEAAALRLESRITGLQQQATALIRQGLRVPGRKLESSSGHRKWTVPLEHVVALGKMFNKDLMQKPKTITPAQAIQQGIDESIVSDYCAASPGALKLTRSTNTQKIFEANK